MTEYGPPTCIDFLAEPYLGTMQWIGPTGSSIQAANHLISVRLIEELYGNPYRPMAESWLAAMRRAYEDVNTSPEFAELVPTLASYVFLGDPLTPFTNLPGFSLNACARRASDSSLAPMPASFAVGCPDGDGDHLVVEVDLDAAGVLGAIDATDITLSQPVSGALAFYPDGATIHADSAAVAGQATTEFPNGYLRATITVRSFGGCADDSALVSLKGVPLGYVRIHAKSPDVVIDPDGGSGATRGFVALGDFATFGAHFPSSLCNCIHSLPYDACVDFALPDTAVALNDLATLGEHYGHGDVTGSGNTANSEFATSMGAVRLEFTEDLPLTGAHSMRATVVLDGVEPLQAAVIALANSNPVFEYVGWTPETTFEGRTMCTVVERDGIKQVFIGVIGSKHSGAHAGSIGTVEFVVRSDQPAVITEDDFALVAADLLDVEGQARQVSPANRSLFLTPPVFRNELAQNYPNPFNPSTTLAFSLANGSSTVLSIFDVRGTLVRTLVNGHRDTGVHRVSWDGRNEQGATVSSGIYFYRLMAGAFTDTKKMVLVR